MLFTGGTITALIQSDGTPRPVTPMEPLFNLMERSLGQVYRIPIQEALHPHQFAVGVQAGMEKIRAAAQLLRDSDPTAVTIKIDISRAFPTVNRKYIDKRLDSMKVVQSAFRFAYGSTNVVVLTTTAGNGKPGGNELHYMNDGIMQGAAGSPSYFGIALAEALKDAQQAAPDVLVSAYADDTGLTGQIDPAFAAFDRIEASIKAEGGPHLTLSKTKTTFLVGPLTDMAKLKAELEKRGMQDAQISDCITVFGAPMGNRDKCRAEALQKVKEIGKEMDMLQTIINPQIRMILLRHGFVPKITHLLRTLPPDIAAQAAEEHDKNIHAQLRLVVGDDITAKEVAQSQLPVTKAGFALFSAAAVRNVAYIASMTTFFKSVERDFPTHHKKFAELLADPAQQCTKDIAAALKTLTDMLSELSIDPAKYPTSPLHLLDPNRQCKQKHLTKILTKKLAKTLSASLNEKDQVRMASQQGFLAMQFYNAIPDSKSIWKPDEYKTRLRMALGLPLRLLPANEPTAECICGREATDHHLLTCTRLGGASQRHERVRLSVAGFARKGLLHTTLTELRPSEKSRLMADGRTDLPEGTSLWDTSIVNSGTFDLPHVH
jgi:hypothetical protein